jgi:hypothetical protein
VLSHDASQRRLHQRDGREQHEPLVLFGVPPKNNRGYDEHRERCDIT